MIFKNKLRIILMKMNLILMIILILIVIIAAILNKIMKNLKDIKMKFCNLHNQKFLDQMAKKIIYQEKCNKELSLIKTYRTNNQYTKIYSKLIHFKVLMN